VLPPLTRRCMSAMALAYSEALPPILDASASSSAGRLPVESLASRLLAGVAGALFWGPPALATDQRLQAAAAKCIGLVPQVSSLLAGAGVRCLRVGRHAASCGIVLLGLV